MEAPATELVLKPDGRIITERTEVYEGEVILLPWWILVVLALAIIIPVVLVLRRRWKRE